MCPALNHPLSKGLPGEIRLQCNIVLSRALWEKSIYSKVSCSVCCAAVHVHHDVPITPFEYFSIY